MPKTDPETLAYPSYPAGSRPAIALEAFKALIAEQPDWCQQNMADRDTLTTRVLDALAKVHINVGPQKARKIADRVLNDIYHTTRKANPLTKPKAVK